MKHDPHHGPHHHPHHGPHHPHPLPGLNSVFSEALSEHSFQSMEDLRILVESREPRLTPALDRILTEGIDDPHLAIELLQIEEAVERLRSQREMILLSSSRKAVAILPLPPHLWHRLEEALHGDLVFSSEDHLPPHLAFEHYQQIESLMPRDLNERTNNLEAIVLEGCLEDGSLLIRRSAARFVQMIAGTNGKLRLFVHVIPHRPRHAEFCKLDSDNTVILI